MRSKYRHPRGEEPYRSSTAKLTESDVRNIRTLLSDGYLIKDIAKGFGVSPTTIGSIKRGYTWSHVR